MKTYSNSKGYTFSKHCPYALKQYEDRAEMDRGVFHGGVASHAVMQSVGEANIPFEDQDSMIAIADKTVEILISQGRSFEGKNEPPIPPDDAFAGRDIAVKYLQCNDVIPPNADFEIGLGMNIDGKPCEFFDDSARWRAILDVRYKTIVEDEDYSVNAVVVRDYKTSWQTTKDELDTTQMKGQAVLAWLHCDKATTQAIVREVTNLRTWQTYREVTVLDDAGIALLERWKKDIFILCNAMDKTREPAPGAGCIDCNYNLSCKHCLEQYKKDDGDRAILYATLEAVRKETIKILKGQAKDGPIEVPGGIIEFRQCKKSKPSKESVQQVVEHWYMSDPEEHSSERALLKAMEMTAGNVKALIDQMYPEKDDVAREELFELCLEPVFESHFGVYKK